MSEGLETLSNPHAFTAKFFSPKLPNHSHLRMRLPAKLCQTVFRTAPAQDADVRQQWMIFMLASCSFLRRNDPTHLVLEVGLEKLNR